jgi:hypothetical protein
VGPKGKRIIQVSASNRFEIGRALLGSLLVGAFSTPVLLIPFNFAFINKLVSSRALAVLLVACPVLLWVATTVVFLYAKKKSRPFVNDPLIDEERMRLRPRIRTPFLGEVLFALVFLNGVL